MADSLRRIGAMDAINGVSQMHRASAERITRAPFSSVSQPGIGGQPLYSTLTSGPILLRRLSRIDHQLLPDSYLFRGIELAPRTLQIIGATTTLPTICAT